MRLQQGSHAEHAAPTSPLLSHPNPRPPRSWYGHWKTTQGSGKHTHWASMGTSRAMKTPSATGTQRRTTPTYTWEAGRAPWPAEWALWRLSGLRRAHRHRIPLPRCLLAPANSPPQCLRLPESAPQQLPRGCCPGSDLIATSTLGRPRGADTKTHLSFFFLVILRKFCAPLPDRTQTVIKVTAELTHVRMSLSPESRGLQKRQRPQSSPGGCWLPRRKGWDPSLDSPRRLLPTSRP